MSRSVQRKTSVEPVVRRMSWDGSSDRVEHLLLREWLVANGLGGYASTSVSGICTRKYHGLLVSAMPAPLGRLVMLSNLIEELRFPDGSLARLECSETADGKLVLEGAEYLEEFRLELGLPLWVFKIGEFRVEKRILLPHMQNTVFVSYRLLAGKGPVRLRLKPFMHFKPVDAEVSRDLRSPYTVKSMGSHYEVRAEASDFPVLRLFMHGRDRSLVLSGGNFKDILYRVERQRGYESQGNLWGPGYFRVNLIEGEDATLVASTEVWDVIHALKPAQAFKAEVERRQRLISMAHPEARSGPAAELVLAADQFIIAPETRVAEAARAHAAGGEVRSVIAGYHWFTDWGRDTMISLEGLTLATGRHDEAVYILRTFAHYIRDGLIPNMFPEGKAEGLYHTADATLWFFHAFDKYLKATNDLTTLHQLLPRFLDIVDHHIRGTRFNIGVDPADGLLSQGAAGYQLTWMDAKVGDWVVTPRRGKAVEINGLWYNALRLTEKWLRSIRGDEEASRIAGLADRVRDSFNLRFWYEDGGYLYDVIDGENGDDPAFRPNQVFAFSLENPVLERSRWESVLDAVTRRLLTPFGLRSLSSDHPDFKAHYFGDLCARDAAYHQGTVWSWLIGPFIDAWLKVHPDDSGTARRLLEGLLSHLAEGGIGFINEVFDAEPPFRPEGCIAQAWSVAELLRAWIRTGESSSEK